MITTILTNFENHTLITATTKQKVKEMNQTKLTAGSVFPSLSVPKLGGGQVDTDASSTKYPWTLVVIYRGKHCPICTRYLLQLNEILPKLNDLGVNVIALSADTAGKAEQHMKEVNPAYSIGYELSIQQMEALGLYISNPRSPDESDRPFSEPGLFVINEKNQLQVVDISNAPFARPELGSLLMGLGFIRNPDNNYPIRGTY